MLVTDGPKAPQAQEDRNYGNQIDQEQNRRGGIRRDADDRQEEGQQDILQDAANAGKQQ